MCICCQGEHVLQRYELDAMGQSFEREDIIQSYVPYGRAVSTLSHEEMQEIIAQADSRLKRAKGKAWMPHVRRALHQRMWAMWIYPCLHPSQPPLGVYSLPRRLSVLNA